MRRPTVARRLRDVRSPHRLHLETIAGAAGVSPREVPGTGAESDAHDEIFRAVCPFACCLHLGCSTASDVSKWIAV